MTSRNKTDCHNLTEVDRQLNLVVPLQNVYASVHNGRFTVLKKYLKIPTEQIVSMLSSGMGSKQPTQSD